MNLSEKFWQQILFSCFLISNNRTNLQRVESSPIEILNLDFETLDSQYISAKIFFQFLQQLRETRVSLNQK